MAGLAAALLVQMEDQHFQVVLAHQVKDTLGVMLVRVTVSMMQLALAEEARALPLHQDHLPILVAIIPVVLGQHQQF